MSPEFQNAASLNEKIAELEVKKETLEKENARLSSSVEKLRQEAIFFEDSITFQDFGLYTPRYNFVTAEEYKLRLDKIRTQH